MNRHLLVLLFVAVASMQAQRDASTLAEERKALAPLLEMKSRVQERVRVPLGYSADNMSYYKNDKYLLRTVQQAFGDAWLLPRLSGNAARKLATSTGLGSMIQSLGSWVDVSAGRMLPVLVDTSAAMDTLWPIGMLPNERRAAERQFGSLPLPTQILVAQLVLAALEVQPYVSYAYRSAPHTTLRERVENTSQAEKTRTMVRSSMSPWIDDRLGQYATTDAFGLDGLGAIDLDAMTFAGVLLATHLDSMITRWQRSPIGSDVQAPIALHTRAGWIICTGVGNDNIRPDVSPILAVIDAGGNDIYHADVAATTRTGQLLSIVIDREGDDVYGTTTDTASVCAGLLGIAALVDLKGNDTYRCGHIGIAAAVHGIAMLSDQHGNDTYELSGTYGQSAATAGLSLLDDRAGDDRYTCAAEAQAYAQTLGAAALVDHKGNDTYLARLDGAPSELYLGQSVSRAQGAAFGRRADLGDGHSLAAGVALLLDVMGDDTYTAGAWGQGCGYWWGLGMIEDWDGNDTYTNGKYSLGAAAHYAIGVQVDLRGDDKYNVGNAAVVNQYQGHARDGSIGVSVDGAGNDQYLFRTHCAGSADLSSIGLFWDRAGDDAYTINYTLVGPANGWADTPPCGTTTRNKPSGTFRDELPSIGVFIDGMGLDDVIWEGELSEHQAYVRLGFSAQREEITPR